MSDNDNRVFGRRRVLKYLGGAGMAGLAGCTGGGDGGGGSPTPEVRTVIKTVEGEERTVVKTKVETVVKEQESDQILLTTAGGTPGGVGYAIMNAVLSAASSEYPSVTYNILPGGWVGNNTRLQNKELDLGHTTLAAGTLAYNLNDPYHDKDWSQPPSNIRSVLADQSEIFYFVVAQPDFPYANLTEAAADDYPIKVTNQPKGTFGGFIWDTVLQELDYGQDKIQELGGSYRRVDWNDAAQLYSDGQIDAILAVGGRDLGWLNNIAAQQDVKYLDWEEDFRTSFHENFGVLKADLEGVFPKQDGTLNCTQDSGLINSQVDASEEGIYLVTKGAIRRAKQIQQSSGLLSRFEAASSLHEPVPFDLHPGAERAYEEEGLL